MSKFKNKYRIESARLPYWDYGANAAYFVTICTKNRIHHFGKIQNGEMQPSPIGIIANNFWLEIPEHFGFVKLGAHIIMPDHMHGIVIIDKSSDMDVGGIVEASKLDVGEIEEMPKLDVGEIGETPKLDVSPISPRPISPTSITYNATKKWKPGILGVIINQYKRICTIHARKIDPDFVWQSRYYDHIIRTEKSFAAISRYIIKNPENWKGR